MAVHPTCIFCGIISGAAPSVRLYEDDDTLAFMDKHPANDGHCLVVPKAHYETIFETPPEVFAAVARAVVRTAAAVQRALQPGPRVTQRGGADIRERDCVTVDTPTEFGKKPNIGSSLSESPT